MKKKKGDKPKVQDLIKAQHDDLAILATRGHGSKCYIIVIRILNPFTFLFQQVCEVPIEPT